MEVPIPSVPVVVVVEEAFNVATSPRQIVAAVGVNMGTLGVLLTVSMASFDVVDPHWVYTITRYR